MPWIKEEKLYLIVVLLLILIMGIRTPLDSDMWWHLRAGEETWRNQEVYAVDTFSFTREGEGWINHSWLSQVVMFGIFSAGGYYGLSIWVGLCAVLSLAFVYLGMEGHPLIRAVVLVLAAVVSSVVWSPRPQIHSLVLFSLLYFLLNQFKKSAKTGYLIGALPVFLLWGNLHGGYILGIILVGSLIVGELVDKALLDPQRDDFSWKKIGFLGLFLLGYLLIVLVNPFGLDMWRIPFNTVGVEVLQNVINEWASPDFHQAFQQPMLWMLLGLFALVGLSKKKVSGAELVPLLMFSWAALTARRNFGPFAIIAAPVFASYLEGLLGVWIKSARQRFIWLEDFLVKAEQSNTELRPGIKNAINTSLIVALLAAAAWKVVDVNKPEFVAQAERDLYPVEAAEWLGDSELEGNMFNDYNWGGFLIWNLRERQVFVDGRTDLFGDEILEEYLAVLGLDPDWEEILESYGVSFLVIRKDSALGRAAYSEGWKPAFESEKVVVLTK